MTPFKLTLHEAPRKRAICETKMRYEVHVNGKFAEDIYFNTHGYVGYLPRPCGRPKIDIGERPLAAFKREIASINREAKSLINEGAQP